LLEEIVCPEALETYLSGIFVLEKCSESLWVSSIERMEKGEIDAEKEISKCAGMQDLRQCVHA
jgi:hypothetical protein